MLWFIIIALWVAAYFVHRRLDYLDRRDALRDLRRRINRRRMARQARARSAGRRAMKFAHN